MLKRGHRTVSHQVRNIAECALAFSLKLRGEEEFPSEEIVREALARVHKRNIVAVVGNKGAGKSSVLDLLSGSSFFSKMEAPALARRWAFSPASGDYAHDGVETKYYPADFLDEIELLDTRGTDELESPVHLIRALSDVDLIVFVIDARDPQSGSAWQFLAQLPAETCSRMVVAITHEDFFNYDQQQEIKSAVRKQSELHLGVELPLYMLRAGGEFRGQGAEALSRRINSMLDTLIVQSEIEENLLRVTRVLLGEQKHVLHNQDMLSRLDAGFLSNIENEIDQLHGQIEKVVPVRLQAIAKFVQECVPMLARKASRQLGYYLSIKSLSRLNRMSFYIDDWFYEYIRKGIEEQHEFHNAEFIKACEEHWNYIRPRVKDQLDCEIGPFPREEMTGRLDLYRKRLGRAIYGPLMDFGLKPCLTKLYSGHKGWMKTQLVVVLLLIILAGILGGLGESMAGVILLLCATGLWFLSSIVLAFVRMRMSSQIIEAAKDMHLAMQSGLRLPLYEATISGVTDYRKLYTNIRGYVAISASQIAPLMDEHSKLFYQLSALSHRI